jgi:AcrR family transcriptional regulator
MLAPMATRTATSQGVRRTQAERRARSRGALLEAAARGLSRNGYANLVLGDVAREAGYTRGALYHQFKDKEELALAVLRWADETWQAEVGSQADRAPDPVSQLLTMARAHAVLCRRDLARVVMALRVEFSRQDHPVGREIKQIQDGLVRRVEKQINAGRRDGSIPAGAPAKTVAIGVLGAMEGTVITLAGRAPYDEELAARAVAGVLGLPPSAVA